MRNPKATSRELTMTFAGKLVQHLGLQMYSGAVPAIAELIANAWDAEATQVKITIPLGVPLTPSSPITVHDDGHGMSFDECNDEYLVVGRDRREADGDKSKNNRRRVMAHKGIGKLAGFGIANEVRVRSVKEQHLTEFRMKYDDIVKGGQFVKEYKPEILADTTTTGPNGTTIRLTGIKITRAIPEGQFRQSMLRRFAVYSDQFQVFVNDNLLKKEEIDFQFRFPKRKAEWETAKLANGKLIQWWGGFTKDTIPDEEARGITVLARGKLVQAPWFFGLSGGVYGQHGLQYMTGEVVADWLDDKEDLVATDRATVMWEHPLAYVLQDWGQSKVKELLTEWVKGRVAEKLEHLRKRTPLMARVEKFPLRERRELTKAIGKLSEIPTLEDDRLQELVEFLIRAYENEHFLAVIRQLKAADPGALAQVLQLLAEWDVLEAVATAQIVRGRIEVINTFEKLINAGAREKPEMHEFLKQHPWLVDPTWTMVEHEKGLDTVLERHFDKKKAPRQTKERLDFFCLADAARVLVVEVKRPAEQAGKKELRQLADYVDYLKQQGNKSSDPERPARSVQGYLIAGGLDEDAIPERERLHADGIFVRPWDQLVRTAREAHKQFLDVVRKRAPASDPRIQALETAPVAVPKGECSPAKSDRKRTQKRTS
jgi:Histidine kinase-, DNA gyrase B-, and HSP90-like ATPase